MTDPNQRLRKAAMRELKRLLREAKRRGDDKAVLDISSKILLRIERPEGGPDPVKRPTHDDLDLATLDADGLAEFDDLMAKLDALKTRTRQPGAEPSVVTVAPIVAPPVVAYPVIPSEPEATKTHAPTPEPLFEETPENMKKIGAFKLGKHQKWSHAAGDEYLDSLLARLRDGSLSLADAFKLEEADERARRRLSEGLAATYDN